MKGKTVRILWLLAGLLSLGLGVVGAALPLLPTVPFLLLAAFFFARSSRRLHDWLLEHNVFGPPIADWRKAGIIRRKAKIYATVSIASAVIFPLWLGVSLSIIAIQVLVLGGVILFIWTRPEG